MEAGRPGPKLKPITIRTAPLATPSNGLNGAQPASAPKSEVPVPEPPMKVVRNIESGQHVEDNPTPFPFQFEIVKAELLKLSNINIAASTFKAQLWLQVAVRGAAHDPDFPTEEIKFPIGPDGKPTFRPSAGWFLDKLEFCNAEGVVKLLDKLIRVEGEDVYIAARWEGMFFERFELHDFPFDLQCLTMSLSINCRTTGPIPTNWAVSSETSTFVSSDEQLLGDAWRLKLRSMLLRTHLVGVDADRLFPTISISAVIQRQSHYFVTNGVIPFALFSFLSMMQFCLHLKLRDLDDTGDGENPDTEGEAAGGSNPLPVLLGHINHRSQMSLMVVFTCAAYKMAIGGRMPVVAYLTLLDKCVAMDVSLTGSFPTSAYLHSSLQLSILRFMLLNSLFVVLVAIQSRLASLLIDVIGPYSVSPFDMYSAIAFGAAWLVCQFWFWHRANKLRTMARPREQALEANPEFVSIWNPNDQGRGFSRAIEAGRRSSVALGNKIAESARVRKKKTRSMDQVMPPR